MFLVFDAIQEHLNITLYASDGRELETKKVVNVNSLSFEIEAPAGIYLLKVMNHKNQSASLRVVKE